MFDGFESAEFVARIDSLAAELPPGSAIGLFERGAAQDSTGQPAQALALYQAALAAGLVGPRRRRATIQMASSLRNLGRASDAAAILTAELNANSDELDGAVRAFLALALSDLGRDREALGISLEALAGYLPRYGRSLARYAEHISADAKRPRFPGPTPAPRTAAPEPATADTAHRTSASPRPPAAQDAPPRP